MTLNYALIADKGIVLGSDSEAIHSHIAAEFGDSRIVATYREKKRKLRILRNGCAFSVAGNSGLVDELLAKADAEGIDDSKPFEPVAHEYQRVFQNEYTKSYGNDQGTRPNCEFLFCGYDGKGKARIPKIIKLSSHCWFSWNSIGSAYGFGFSGRESHGAVLYLHHRLHTPRMPLESAKCLVYSALAEVAELDNIVGLPIQMVVVTRSGPAIEIGQTELNSYNEKRKRIVPALRSVLFPASRSSTQIQKV